MQSYLPWPPMLYHFLQSYGISALRVEQLHGLSHNHVWRVLDRTTSFIVKAAPTAKEVHFYQAIAPLLNAQGVATPHLLWADTCAPTTWFVLEDIPTSLPRTRWHADPEVLTTLSRLHCATIHSTPLALFTPEWTDALTQSAIVHVPTMQRTAVERKLRRIQAQSQHLFSSQCWISGDPNPRNWGIRRDGMIVLYDWERFGRGTPALDLAITVPGLGDWSVFEQVARQYLHTQSIEPFDGAAIAIMTRSIGYAKVWNVVEFLAMVTRGEVKQTEGVRELGHLLPNWLEKLST